MLKLTPSDGRAPAVIVANDHVTLAEVKTALRSFARSDWHSGVIWDMRQADLGELHCRDLKDLVETVSAVLPNNDAYRVAILGKEPLHFGLFRAFQTYAEFAGLKREYGYFAELTEAHEWIGARAAMINSGLPWASAAPLSLAGAPVHD